MLMIGIRRHFHNSDCFQKDSMQTQSLHIRKEVEIETKAEEAMEWYDKLGENETIHFFFENFFKNADFDR